MGHEASGGEASARELLETKAAGFFSSVLFTLALICSALSCCFILRTGPPIRQSFVDMRMALDTFTRLCVGGHALWSIVALAVLSIAKEALVRPVFPRLIANGVHLVAVLTISWLYLLGILEPFFGLFEQIGEG
ncbi:MAG: hypothetical protein FJ291_25060 [Planctomycetes bacterium]|nr:hypothetical protein [Planctomycetota bacterium]